MWIKDWDKTKIAELQPLTRKDLTKNGKNLIPQRFFVHNYYDDKLEEHETQPGYDFSKWDEFLSDGRIYVEKDKTPIGKQINESLLI